jgi:MFS superfamily sulfate permease-like transporter
MAYGLLAGLTVEAGLYTALAAMLVYPLFGSTRLLIVTSSSSLAVLTGAAVSQVSQAQGVEPVVVAAALALAVSGFMVAAGLLRLGFLANYISLPVLVGFQAGVGIVLIGLDARGVETVGHARPGCLFANLHKVLETWESGTPREEKEAEVSA